MKAKINFRHFGGEISIKDGDAIISSKEERKEDFSIHLTEIANKKITDMVINPSSLGKYLKIVISDAKYDIYFEQDIGNEESLIITRCEQKLKKQFSKRNTIEYFTKNGQWIKKSFGRTPNNALRIPLFKKNE